MNASLKQSIGGELKNCDDGTRDTRLPAISEECSMAGSSWRATTERAHDLSTGANVINEF